MRVLITGAGGQLGRALQEVLGREQDVVALTRHEGDITDPGIVARIVQHRPDVIINAAAWTDVDGAEREPDAAFAVNAWGAQNLALAARAADCDLVHVSTNEVFPGRPGVSYSEFDDVGPVNTYARSKLAGEQMVRTLWPRHYVVRTAWVFFHGGTNFITKIVAAADRFGRLRVVADEFGNPTYALDLAQAIVRLISTRHYGVYHFTNRGYCSRYEYARAILRLAGRAHVPVVPIQHHQWKRLATPPRHAVLRNTLGPRLGITLRSWEEALEAYFARESKAKGTPS